MGMSVDLLNLSRETSHLISALPGGDVLFQSIIETRLPATAGGAEKRQHFIGDAHRGLSLLGRSGWTTSPH